MKQLFLIFIFIFTSITIGFSNPSTESSQIEQSELIWEKLQISLKESEINRIFIPSFERSTLYICTAKALYRISRPNLQVQEIFYDKGSAGGINDCFIAHQSGKRIFAATNSGLYVSKDLKGIWQREYYSQDPDKRKCLSVLSSGGKIYLGTQKGLFIKEFESSNWQKQIGDFSKSPVTYLIEDNQYIYITTFNKVYRLNKITQKIQRIFSVLGSQIDEEADQFTLNNREVRAVTSFAVENEKSSFLFIATTSGLFCSLDNGEKWHRIETIGLPVEELNSLVVLNKPSDFVDSRMINSGSAIVMAKLKLFAGTEKGIFGYVAQRWIPVYQGLETNQINDLAFDPNMGVYAATKRGLFFMPNEKALTLFESNQILNLSYEQKQAQAYPFTSYLNIQKRFAHEPSVFEVQNRAIDYAEVNEKKIKNWRKQAKQKALLPDVSVGIDRSASYLFHWNTGANPDELQKGRDYVDWDVSLSWDLGDFIWSTDQTSIDSRSKMMVELREDILDQVTRLYFERRRMQIELLAYSSMEPSLKVDKQMRIAELTALLDAYTGGWFSFQIEKGVNADERRLHTDKRR